MTKLYLAIISVFSFSVCYSQDSDVKRLNKIVDAKTGLEPLHFLASDKLKGRSPKRPEIHVAADYIANHFKKSGIKQVGGAANYFQLFDLGTSTPPSGGSLSVGNSRFEISKQLLQVRGQDISLNAPVIYAGYGNKEDINDIDVKGKIVVTKLGINDSSTASQGFAQLKNKESFFIEKGAIALIEVFWQKDIPWTAVLNNFSKDRSAMNQEPLPVFLLNPDDSSFLSSIKNITQASVSTSGNKQNKIPAKNVMGWVQGTDPVLRKEYIVLSAHYDHIGVTNQPVNTDGRLDSIYNGARDNAIGVTAVINAAKYFSKHPPRRSVLFILYTAEEMGMVGSRYFSEHPTVPIKQMVFNLNCDNGGYNDTSIAMVVGLGRTSADNDMKDACTAYNITAIADPVPELNLFDRSDNVNLAVKGVPAPTFGMGVRSFDDEVKKYYHQPADEVATFNLRYALTYVRAYVLAAKKIADNPSQPAWTAGDKYETAWKELYNKQSAMQNIETTVAHLRKAILEADTTALDNLMADELSYGHSDGHVEGKTDFIRKTGDGTYRFVTMELSKQTIREVGNTAIVRHELDGKTNDAGKPNEAHLYVLLIWNKYENGWKLIARQAVKKKP